MPSKEDMQMVSYYLDKGLHSTFYADPTICDVRSFGTCPQCSNSTLKYGQVERPFSLLIVLGCSRCHHRWFWRGCYASSTDVVGSSSN